jgi:hypothetical protein
MGEPKPKAADAQPGSGVRASIGAFVVREALGGDARADALMRRALAAAGVTALPREGVALLTFARLHLAPLVSSARGDAAAAELLVRLANEVAAVAAAREPPRSQAAVALLLVTRDGEFADAAKRALGEAILIVDSAIDVPRGTPAFVVVDGATVDALAVVERLQAADAPRAIVWRDAREAASWRDRADVRAQVVATSASPPDRMLKLLTQIARRQAE